MKFPSCVTIIVIMLLFYSSCSIKKQITNSKKNTCFPIIYYSTNTQEWPNENVGSYCFRPSALDILNDKFSGEYSKQFSLTIRYVINIETKDFFIEYDTPVGFDEVTSQEFRAFFVDYLEQNQKLKIKVKKGLLNKNGFKSEQSNNYSLFYDGKKFVE
ncbi:MAG: hypothetical protein KDC82_04875 [Bacteroidetes bacterium]|nr:hypothetical protein [Bacteroidota bacterium]